MRGNRIFQFVFGLAGLGLMLTQSQAALAQELSVASHKGGGSSAAAVLSGGTGTKACSEADPGRRGIEPYTATSKTTQVQKLANGVTITHESTGMEAVDSSGRRYQKMQPSVSSGADMRIAETFFFNVYDPVSQTTTNWSSDSKEATVFHFPEPGKVQHSATATQLSTLKLPEFKPVQPKVQAEDLGTKTIDGLEVTGARTTMTYPAGSIGNDQPLVITNEDWRSTELGIEVLQINDDPRTGVRTMELTDVERGEPDPALFQVPEGFTIRDQNPMEQN
ncbi:MAG: hypothetical protein ABR956_11955 [Terracidiphilus sp.]|jgi:hypothetical protein